MGSLPESLTQGLLVGKLLVGGPGVYIYIYRERERCMYVYLSLSLYIYIYIYTHTYVLMVRLVVIVSIILCVVCRLFLCGGGHTYVCMYIYIYIYKCVYIYIYISYYDTISQYYMGYRYYSVIICTIILHYIYNNITILVSYNRCITYTCIPYNMVHCVMSCWNILWHNVVCRIIIWYAITSYIKICTMSCTL